MPMLTSSFAQLRAPRAPLAICVFAAIALMGCSDHELGAQLDEGAFGNPTMNNVLYHSGERQYVSVLAERFVAEVPTTVTFTFNSAILEPEAQAILRQQADFIRNFPEARFSVYGHTDLVGSESYNQQLGLRRARAVVDFLVSHGIHRARLDALVSRGESEPLVATQSQERRNRRTVTEVSGFVRGNPLVHDGRYAQIVYRAYAQSGGGEIDGQGAVTTAGD
jgi:outer membrane protein OmpA-like peptidoglycan-associated protein